MLGWSVSPFYPGSLVSTLLERWEFTPLFSFSTFIIATWWGRKLPVQPGSVLQCTWPSFSVRAVSKLLCTADPTHFSSLDDLKKADADYDVRDWLLNFWLLFLWRNTCRDQLKEEGRVYSASRFEAVVSAWWCRSHGSRNVRGGSWLHCLRNQKAREEGDVDAQTTCSFLLSGGPQAMGWCRPQLG